MEHSKRSGELCGWAVVYDGSAEGDWIELALSLMREVLEQTPKLRYVINEPN